MYIEYELHCSCGATKTENTRVHIIQWLLDHCKNSEPLKPHMPRILWRCDNRVRELDQQEIDEFIDYIESGEMEKHNRQYPFGMPGLGQGPRRPFSKYGIPR
jgi:hypothetical protein